MTPYQQLIAVSRYSRWLPEENKRETWEETVDRYMTNVVGKYILPEDPLYTRIKNSIINLDTMPSMRMLMTAGPALERDNMAGFNPVSGDTLVLTKEHGNVPIEQLEGKTCHVLNKDGRWAVAAFRGYGKQAVSKVRVRLNSNTVKEVLATVNHRWYKTDGNVVSTAELNVGDRLPFVSAPKPAEDLDYHLGIKHGLVYGDGAAVKSHGRTKGYHIRLCGGSRELIKYLAEYPTTYPPSANGDPVVMMYDSFAATHSLKELPHEETDSYKLGFLRGWFAADGSVSANGQISICAADEGRKWLRDHAETVGWVVQSDYEFSDRTNFGMRTRRQWSVRFSRSSLTEEDMLCSWKRASMRSLNSHFVVASVEPAGEAYVYCAEVEDTNTFTLKGGLLTGNCSFIAMDDVRAFDEIMYILTCGTGAGFSAESEYVNKLPSVTEEFHDTDTVIVVSDSRIGWSTSFRELIALLYSGKIPKFDFSKVRKKGERLKTFGGRASGPEPLENLFNYCINVFRNAAGRKLTDIEVHSIVCKIGEVVVVGGVRRSALISLSDLGSDAMANAKSGNWYNHSPELALANNSAVYSVKPSIGSFIREWLVLYNSKSGERGIFNRQGVQTKARKNGRADPEKLIGTNP